MEGIPRIHAEPQDEARSKLARLFFDIERNARLSGNAQVLMQLDRVPGLVLGPTNRVSEGAEDAALTEAYAALQSILVDLEQPTTTKRD
jgi:hypothetical protein